MTFTYGSDLTDANDYVRFHTGDTVEAEAYLSDEEITSLIAVEGSNNAAVIAALRYILLKLSKPNFRADWLQVDYKAARDGIKDLLKEKRNEFGISKYTASVTHVYRADSLQSEEPDYDS